MKKTQDSTGLYQRVASANPQAAAALIRNFGYELQTRNIAKGLYLLVQNEGEPALRAIVDIHPDKELILECLAPAPAVAATEKNNTHEAMMFLNASGQISQLTEAQKNTQITNTFLIASTLIIITALILKH